jgi:hypothetical protein
MYRATPQSTTAEFLFGRKLRTKLPELGNTNINDFEVWDRDGEHKEKGKMYADEKRYQAHSNLEIKYLWNKKCKTNYQQHLIQNHLRC